MAKDTAMGKETPPESKPSDAGAPTSPPPPRNTLVPSFDVATFARAVDGPSARPALVTVTNETELEAARVRSMKSSMPPARERVRSEAEVEIGTAEVEVEIDELLQQSAEAVLGDLTGVPTLRVSGSEVPSLGLDHYSGFLLALVDGALTYETILDVCGMSRAEALDTLATLVRRGVIGPRK